MNEPVEETTGEDETVEPEGNGSDHEDEEGEESFLDPYYQSTDSSGCRFPGCFDSLDLLDLIAGISVRYNSEPFRHGGVRAVLGEQGNSFALSAGIGVTRVGGKRGFSSGLLILTPCPVGFDILYERVNTGREDFSLFYGGVVSQIVFDSPFQLLLGPQAVFPREDGRWTLAGVGILMKGSYLFLDGKGISADYRLSWIGGLPLHRYEMRLSWFNAPFEIWAGYSFLRNCAGEMLHGPCAGSGVQF